MRHTLRPLLVPALCAVGISLASCSGDGDDSPATADTTAASSAVSAPSGATSGEGAADTGAADAGSSTACTSYSGETVEANSNPGEPVITVPVPEGWVRTTQLDSEVIRLALADGTVTAPPVPTVNVIIDKVTGHPADTLAQALNQLETTLAPKDLATQETSVCGFPALRADYTSKNVGEITWDITQYMVAVPATDGQVLATFTLMAGAPASEDFVALREEIIDGIRITDADGATTTSRA